MSGSCVAWGLRVAEPWPSDHSTQNGSEGADERDFGCFRTADANDRLFGLDFSFPSFVPSFGTVVQSDLIGGSGAANGSAGCCFRPRLVFLPARTHGEEERNKSRAGTS